MSEEKYRGPKNFPKKIYTTSPNSGKFWASFGQDLGKICATFFSILFGEEKNQGRKIRVVEKKYMFLNSSHRDLSIGVKKNLDGELFSRNFCQRLSGVCPEFSKKSQKFQKNIKHWNLPDPKF